MSNVARVNEWEKDGKKRWYVDFEDGSKAVCFSETAATLETGKPLPDGWVIEAPKQEGWTPMLKAPRKPGGGGFGGGAAAFRNTKEGQAIEQERMDRRTALMQAVAVESTNSLVALAIASEFYDWLRSTAGIVPAASAAAGGGSLSVAHVEQASSTAQAGMRGTADKGQGSDGEAGPCPTYFDHTFKRVDGKFVCSKCGAPK